MAVLVCDICGGKLVSGAGNVAACDSCGMEHSQERIREKVQEIKGNVAIEGTVDVKGTVKVDNSVKLDNLYKVARRAKNDGNSEKAAQYYEQILLEEPNDWEAAFYFAYCSSMQNYRNNKIGTAITLVMNCIDGIFNLVRDNIQDIDEQETIIKEIVTKITQCNELYCEDIEKDFEEFWGAFSEAGSSSHNDNVLKEHCKQKDARLIAISQVYVSLGERVLEISGNNSELGNKAKSMFQKAIDLIESSLSGYTESNEKKGIINSYKERRMSAMETPEETEERHLKEYSDSIECKRKSLQVQLQIVKICFLVGIIIGLFFAVKNVFVQRSNMEDSIIYFIVSLGICLALPSIIVVSKKAWKIIKSIDSFLKSIIGDGTFLGSLLSHNTSFTIKIIIKLGLFFFALPYLWVFFVFASPIITIYRFFTIKKELRERFDYKDNNNIFKVTAITKFLKKTILANADAAPKTTKTNMVRQDTDILIELPTDSLVLGEQLTKEEPEKVSNLENEIDPKQQQSLPIQPQAIVPIVGEETVAGNESKPKSAIKHILIGVAAASVVFGLVFALKWGKPDNVQSEINQPKSPSEVESKAVESNKYNASEFINKFFERAKANSFDGLNVSSTLQVLLDNSIYGNDVNAANEHQAIYEKPQRITNDISISSTTFYFINPFYSNSNNGRKYYLEEKIGYIRYSLNLTEQAANHANAIIEALKTEIEKRYGIEMKRITYSTKCYSGYDEKGVTDFLVVIDGNSVLMYVGFEKGITEKSFL